VQTTKYLTKILNIYWYLIRSAFGWVMRKRWIAQNNKSIWDFENFGVYLVHIEGVRYKI
jgi:hypothetical protein